eukprot:NODE_348_length_3137_cov_6.759468.p1 GENE.NODE_348_length_3137_cov_6.759468~~NODE_348_length_3137_cov_6.759468.p1  ORF type:complete len:873 (-),score=229.91 NODE_348_length_3137_cov_6.759468:332-2950(-)
MCVAMPALAFFSQVRSATTMVPSWLFASFVFAAMLLIVLMPRCSAAGKGARIVDVTAWKAADCKEIHTDEEAGLALASTSISLPFVVLEPTQPTPATNMSSPLIVTPTPMVSPLHSPALSESEPEKELDPISCTPKATTLTAFSFAGITTSTEQANNATAQRVVEAEELQVASKGDALLPATVHVAGKQQQQAQPQPQPQPQPQTQAQPQPQARPQLQHARTEGAITPSMGTYDDGGRIMLLYASPLCCFKNQRKVPTPMTQLPYEREWDVLMKAHVEACPTQQDGFSRRFGRSYRRRPNVSFAAQPFTARSLQEVIAPGSSGTAAVLHLSAHGGEGYLVAENGIGTAHLITCDGISLVLKLRSGVQCPKGKGLRLVVLNACRSRAIGMSFVDGGIAHVICTSSDVRDGVSNLFLQAFYVNLFRGNTVKGAFSAAIVALASAPEPPNPDSFSLLPEGASHDEVLFMPVPSSAPTTRLSQPNFAALLPFGVGSEAEEGVCGTNSSSGAEGRTEMSSTGEGYNDLSSDSDGCSTSDETVSCRPFPTSRRETTPLPARPLLPLQLARQPVGRVSPRVLHSPFGRPIPTPPEDLMNRGVDVWAVLQFFSSRRAVVVCGAEGTDHGVGKSVVLNGVHRAFGLQVGGTCISVHLRSLSQPDAGSAVGPAGWIEQVHEMVWQALQDRRPARERRRGSTVGPGVRSRGHSTGALGASTHAMRCVPRSLSRARITSSGNMISRGFHPLSESISARHALNALIADLTALAEVCRGRCSREWPVGSAANGRMLLILDECDHLIQQRHFQEAVAEILESCSSYHPARALKTLQPILEEVRRNHTPVWSEGTWAVSMSAPRRITDRHRLCTSTLSVPCSASAALQ